MDCVVAFVDHWLPVALLEVSVTLPPGQKESGPLALIVGVGIEVEIVTVIAEDVTEVPASVTFTV